jgi:hypothetical protein
MRRSSPDKVLTSGFKRTALKSHRYDGADGPDAPYFEPHTHAACWLKQHDPLDRPCSEVTNGRLEAVHLIGRQAIRRVLSHTLNTGYIWQEDGGIDFNDVEDLIELAEWDPRNAALGCTGHHRRLDSHATPELTLDAEALSDDFFDFVLDWGFESLAEEKFGGQVREVLELREVQREGVAW